MSRIDPEKDFAGFVEERLTAAYHADEEGNLKLADAWGNGWIHQAGPNDIDAIEDLASHFDRAAAEIRAITKAIRRRRNAGRIKGG